MRPGIRGRITRAAPTSPHSALPTTDPATSPLGSLAARTPPHEHDLWLRDAQLSDLPARSTRRLPPIHAAQGAATPPEHNTQKANHRCSP